MVGSAEGSRTGPLGLGTVGHDQLSAGGGTHQASARRGGDVEISVSGRKQGHGGLQDHAARAGGNTQRWRQNDRNRIARKPWQAVAGQDHLDAGVQIHRCLRIIIKQIEADRAGAAQAVKHTVGIPYFLQADAPIRRIDVPLPLDQAQRQIPIGLARIRSGRSGILTGGYRTYSVGQDVMPIDAAPGGNRYVSWLGSESARSGITGKCRG